MAQAHDTPNTKVNRDDSVWQKRRQIFIRLALFFEYPLTYGSICLLEILVMVEILGGVFAYIKGGNPYLLAGFIAIMLILVQTLETVGARSSIQFALYAGQRSSRQDTKKQPTQVSRRNASWASIKALERIGSLVSDGGFEEMVFVTARTRNITIRDGATLLDLLYAIKIRLLEQTLSVGIIENRAIWESFYHDLMPLGRIYDEDELLAFLSDFVLNRYNAISEETRVVATKTLARRMTNVWLERHIRVIQLAITIVVALATIIKLFIPWPFQ